MATELRDRHIAELRRKLDARRNLYLDEIETAAEKAWDAADGVSQQMENMPAHTPAGYAAKARYALLASIPVDQFFDEEEFWRGGRAEKMLLSLIEDLDRARA